MKDMNPFKPIELDPIEIICPKHGAYMAKRTKLSIISNLPLTSGCPQCIESREVIERKHEKLDEARSYGIPERFVEATTESFTIGTPILEDAKSKALQWADSNLRGRNMIILGGSGTGKTHLGCMVLKRIKSQNCIYTNIINILDKVKSSYAKNRSYLEERTESIMGRYSRIDFLVIDNIERFNNTVDNRKLLFSLINNRYENRKSTIIIAGLNSSQLLKLVGYGLETRMKANAEIIDLDPQAKLF